MCFVCAMDTLLVRQRITCLFRHCASSNIILRIRMLVHVLVVDVMLCCYCMCVCICKYACMCARYACSSYECKHIVHLLLNGNPYKLISCDRRLFLYVTVRCLHEHHTIVGRRRCAHVRKRRNRVKRTNSFLPQSKLLGIRNESTVDPKRSCLHSMTFVIESPFLGMNIESSIVRF